MSELNRDQMRPSQRLLDGWTRFAIAYPVPLVIIGVLLGGFGVWRATKLEINQDLKALIPEDYPSVTRLNALSDRIGSQSELIVEIKSPDREANIRYGEELAKRMRQRTDLFRHVEFRRDVEWFRHNALLFLPLDRLLDLRTRVVRRIRDEVASEVVEDIDDAPAPKASGKDEDDPLDLADDELQRRYGAEYDVPSEFIETQDGDVNLMVVRARPIQGTTNVEFSEGLVAAMRDLLEDMNPSSYHPKLEAAVKGEYEERTGEVSSIKDDLLGSTGYALLVLVVVLMVHFKRPRAVLLILGPLLLSILVALAAATYIFPWLNLVTAFIFVVLLGLGIDFGIHWLSRYEFERLRGRDQVEALRVAGAFTGVDVAVGALSTAVMFSLFPIADFRGFSQFGVVACIGVLVALVFTVLVLPATIVLLERLVPWKPRRWLPIVDQDLRKGAGRFPRSARLTRVLAIATVAVSFVLAGLSAWKAPQIEFEYDFSLLGKKKVEQPGGGGPPPKTYSDAIGRPDFGPALAMADDPEQGRWVEEQLRGLRRLTDSQMETLLGHPLPERERKHNDPNPDDFVEPLGSDFEADPDDPFAKPEPDPFADLQAQVDRQELAPESKRVLAAYPLDRVREMRYFLWKHLSAWSFVPSQQETKLEIIADIRRRVDDKYEELSAESQEKVDRLNQYLEVTETVGLEDVPEWLRNRWSDNQGVVGRHAILWNRGAKANYEDAKRLYDAFFDLKVGPEAEQQVEAAGNYFVLPEIMDTLRRDGPRVLVAALSAIFVCLMLMFRSLKTTVLILLPLVMSVLWLAGLFYVFHTWDPLGPELRYEWNLEWNWKLNLYNVITFSLLIGMGVDDGVHMVSRWLELGQTSVATAIRETGSAIVLTTVTTSIGFSGLLLADHVGLASLGWTAAIGMMLCLIASVTTLPALLYLLGRKRS